MDKGGREGVGGEDEYDQSTFYNILKIKHLKLKNYTMEYCLAI